jgi:hypothetical protein
VEVCRVDIGRDVRLALGSGGSHINIMSSGLLRRLTCTAGSGADDIDITDCRVAGKTSIATGAGADWVGAYMTDLVGPVVWNSGPESDTMEFETCHVYVSVRLIAGDGDDDVRVVDGSTVHGLLDIRAGDGDDDLQVWNTSIGGRFSANMGAGGDDVYLASAGDGGVTFGGPSAFRMGAGDDYLRLGEDPAVLWFRAPVLLDGGQGTDDLEYGSPSNVFAEGKTETGWENII